MGTRKTKKPSAKQDNILLPSADLLKRLLNGTLRDPHSILGMHSLDNGKGLVIRVYDPEASAITVLAEDGSVLPMRKLRKEGLFAVQIPNRTEHFFYRLERDYGTHKFTEADPYQYLPVPGEMDLFLFNQGEHRKIYDVLGAHVKHYDNNVSGVAFAVWAPNAQRVSVVGDFNCWDGRRHMMRLLGTSGVWDLFIPGLKPGDVYKYEILDANGAIQLKLDPYAQQTERRPHNAGIVPQEKEFVWTDQKWISERAAKNPTEQPVNIYEMHLGTWGGPGLRTLDPDDPDDLHNYRDIAVSLAKYLKEMHYTHVELLPVCEHPLDQSWGYQVTGFYAPTARYGTPEDFAWFVNHMHENGIAVIMDWVPAHFPKDAFSLGRFDGTALYEHADPRQGEQREWGTYIFNFGRCEVRSFLTGSALYWLDKFHVDGLRVDAVASMLYLSYARKEGEWIPNKYGGCENLEAAEFLKHLNTLTHQLFPGTVTAAEESTCWPGVSRPVYLGGLGFTFKWNMGWMHDTLDYLHLDPVYRSYHHNKLTFSLMYAFSENFILPLSHDEVVHGKFSLIGRMPGDYEQKFANMRCLFAYMLTHPGKKLLFMGGEFGQMIEWNCNQALDWLLLKYPAHDALKHMVADLNLFYQQTPALWEQDFRQEGHEWIECGDYRQSVISFIRWDKSGKHPAVIVLNFTPVVRDPYEIGVPLPGKWKEVFNTDRAEYGGTNLLNPIPVEAVPGVMHRQKQHIALRLPWLGAVILMPEGAEEPVDQNERKTSKKRKKV